MFASVFRDITENGSCQRAFNIFASPSLKVTVSDAAGYTSWSILVYTDCKLNSDSNICVVLRPVALFIVAKCRDSELFTIACWQYFSNLP